MIKNIYSKALLTIITTALLVIISAPIATACTRVLYTGADNLVIMGRSMDWNESMKSELWVMPEGLERTGEAGENSFKWKSKYGSVVVASYNAGVADGMNEKGLAAELLYLGESDYGKVDKSRPQMSILLWAQYVLDKFATVDEAVNTLKKEPFQIVAPTLPNGRKASLHLSMSDSKGDSAILEYLDGVLVIHHSKKYKVMTNSPTFDQQLAIEKYWQNIGGDHFLPGTISAADRFVRASFLLKSVPKKEDKNYITSLPDHSFTFQAVSSVLGIMRAVGVPIGITTKDQPNVSSTLWRTVANQRDKVYYFDSATKPNTFWVDLKKIDFKAGVSVKKLPMADGQIYSGEVSSKFVKAKLFKTLPVK